jgi:membrane protease YdiL (CAAX protease family)
MGVVERVWLVVLLLAGPLGAIATRRAARRFLPPRRLAYLSTLRGLSVLGLVTLAVDGFGSRLGIRALRTFPAPASLLLWTAGVLATCAVLSIIVTAVRSALKQPMSGVARLMLPESPADWPLFTAVCLTAGLVEEFVCRGVCLGLLIQLFKSPVLALLIVNASFAFGHLSQGRIAALRSGVLGAILTLPVLATGALLPSIVVHTATNLLTPLWARSAPAGAAGRTAPG